MFYLSNFSFRYPNSNNTIYYNGNITINDGDIVLIHGESGCGKSTLLYALKGIIPNIILGISAGEVLYNGTNVTNLQDKSIIGIVLQNPTHQFIHKTVIEELAFNLENLQYNIDFIYTTIHYYANKMQVEYLLSRDIDQLSGGEAQKIAILSVIMTKPKVLLLDEPTAFLDIKSILHLLDMISNLDYKPTIIIIEHNYKYLKNIIDSTIYIHKNGELTQSNIFPTVYRYKTIKPIYQDNIILSIDNLYYKYGDKQLIDGFSLKLHKQEIIGICGKSGCGKSTLLKLISGLIDNYQGNIVIKNKPLSEYKNYDLYLILALLNQNPENHFLENKVIDEVSNIDELDNFNLLDVKEQNPFTLSEGQKRRLSILSLNKFIKQREIYLLDEPTFGQDYNNINKLIEIIYLLQKNGSSFIIVSHDNDFLQAICNQIIHI